MSFVEDLWLCNSWKQGTGKLENGESFNKPGAEAVLGQAVGGEWVGLVLFFHEKCFSVTHCLATV